jgi:hypothetical protein
MKYVSILFGLLLLAGCSEAPPIRQQPNPVPAVPVIPIVAQTPPPQSTGSKWEDWPNTPGDWVYRRDAKGSVALFGKPGADADFGMRCAAATKRLYLSRAGAFVSGDTGRMTLRASSALKSYAVANADGTPPFVAAELDPKDSQLDAIAFSRGRFIVSVKGATDLVLPAWPEVGRVVEDCRT